MYLNDHLSGKELFIRFTASAFRKLLSIYVFSCFPFGFEDRMWDLLLSIPDHCLSFYSESLRPQYNHRMCGYRGEKMYMYLQLYILI